MRFRMDPDTVLELGDTRKAGALLPQVAVFDEDVSVGRGMLRTAGLLTRPALKFNHALMMRSGEVGLRRLLERGAG